MSESKFQPLITLLLTLICMFSLLFPALAASSGDGIVLADEADQSSPVIVLGDKDGSARTGGKAAAVTLGVAPDGTISDQQLYQQSLGRFTTTGYCNCEKCSGGHSLTYSGTVPKSNHTLSADLDLFPLGTTLMINGVVYTVEDIGSSIEGRRLDIYYDEHAQALEHGMKAEEVFILAE